MTTWWKSSYCQSGECIEVMPAWLKSSYCASTECIEVSWGKSSHSLANGNCVEIGTPLETSTYTGSGNCVEAGPCACGGDILIHDTKECDDPNHCSQVLAFDPEAWGQFLAGIKAGELTWA